MAREFICIECGSLLTHSNELTLESMKEVHSQLCIIKRQRLIAAQSIQDISSKSSPILQSSVQVSQGVAKEPSSMAPSPP